MLLLYCLLSVAVAFYWRRIDSDCDCDAFALWTATGRHVVWALVGYVRGAVYNGCVLLLLLMQLQWPGGSRSSRIRNWCVYPLWSYWRRWIDDGSDDHGQHRPELILRLDWIGIVCYSSQLSALSALAPSSLLGWDSPVCSGWLDYPVQDYVAWGLVVVFVVARFYYFLLLLFFFYVYHRSLSLPREKEWVLRSINTWKFCTNLKNLF